MREICGCDALWDAGSIVADATARTREQVGQDRVQLFIDVFEEESRKIERTGF